MEDSLKLVGLVALLISVVVAILFVVLAVGAALWRFIPMPQRIREATFSAAAVFLLTPVPVHLGVGGMIYPVVVLYGDWKQFQWHLLNWYFPSPWLVLPSFLATGCLAYFIIHRLFPKYTAENKAP
jgi:cytochrome b subunit of formate dehydrogenase